MTLYCEEGWEHDDGSNRTDHSCDSNGNWSADPVRCRGIARLFVTVVENMLFIYNSISVELHGRLILILTRLAWGIYFEVPEQQMLLVHIIGTIDVTCSYNCIF